MNTKPNLMFVLISLLVVGAGAYWYFFMNDGNDVSLTPIVQSSASQVRFQSLVGELMGVTFDTRIFNDPRFMGLVDLATPITPETPGRIDPFAPLGTGALAAASTTPRSTQTTPARIPAATPSTPAPTPTMTPPAQTPPSMP